MGEVAFRLGVGRLRLGDVGERLIGVRGHHHGVGLRLLRGRLAAGNLRLRLRDLLLRIRGLDVRQSLPCLYMIAYIRVPFSHVTTHACIDLGIFGTLNIAGKFEMRGRRAALRHDERDRWRGWCAPKRRPTLTAA